MRAIICGGVLIGLGAAAVSPATSRGNQIILLIIMAVVAFVTFVAR